MARRRTLADLGYQLRRRIVRGMCARKRNDRWAAAHAAHQQALLLRRLTIYVEFMGGKSIEQLVADQRGWNLSEVEQAIRAKGGTA